VTRKWIRDRPHAVYRHYADSGVLLYVGRSHDPDERWRTLQFAQPAWTRYSVRRDDEWYPHMDPATVAEQHAIRTEGPLFNKQCVSGAVRKARIYQLRTLRLAAGRTVPFYAMGDSWYEGDPEEIAVERPQQVDSLTYWLNAEW
jgi:hypothetical protein